MRRFIVSILVLGGILLPAALIAPVHAQVDPFDDACDSKTADATICNTDGSDPISGEQGVLMRAVNILSFIVGAASVIMVLLGGLKYITSNGDSNSVSSAKNTILYAIIGLVVFSLSQVIIRFVISRV